MGTESTKKKGATCPECGEPIDEWAALVEVPAQLQHGPLTVPPVLCRMCLYAKAYAPPPAQLSTHVTPGNPLEWTEPDRQSLDGREVYCGAMLELYMGGGQWMPARYEVEHTPPITVRPFRPVLYLGRPNDLEHTRERNALLALVDDYFSTTTALGVMRPDAGARFRWPDGAGGFR